MSKETFNFSEGLRRMKRGILVKRQSKEIVYKIVKNEIGPEEYSIYSTFRCVNELKLLHRDIDIENSKLPIFKEHTLLSQNILATDWEEVTR